MAKYDHGGGCACGLQRVCDCSFGMQITEEKPQMSVPTPFLLWFYDNIPISSVSNVNGIYVFTGARGQAWQEPCKVVRDLSRQDLITWRVLGADMTGVVVLTTKGIDLIKNYLDTDRKDRAEWERLKKKYGDK